MLDHNVNLVNPSAERLLFSEESASVRRLRPVPARGKNFVDLDEELVRTPKTISNEQ
jgi:hypothetical protein